MRRLRISYALLLAATLAFTLYDELHLRRCLFHRYGHSSFVAGSIPNFLAELLFAFAIATLRLPIMLRDTVRTVLVPAAGLCLYEVVQIWMPSRVFDWGDLTATLIGAAVAWLVLTLVQRVRKIAFA